MGHTVKLKTFPLVFVTFLIGFTQVLAGYRVLKTVKHRKVSGYQRKVIELMDFLIKRTLQLGLLEYEPEAFVAKRVAARHEKGLSVLFIVFLHADLACQNFF